MAGKGGGAWKVAYADFVTAMMAFFMVMWLVSQNQETKEAVQQYFQNPTVQLLPAWVARGPHEKGGSSKKFQGEDAGPDEGKGSKKNRPQRRVRSEDVKHARLLMRTDGDQTVVGSIIAFDEDSAALKDESKTELDQLIPKLAGKSNRIELRGHTTRRPPAEDSKFGDDWQLSFARSVAVMKYLEDAGIEAQRMRLSQAGAFEPPQEKQGEEVDQSRVEVYVLSEFVDAHPQDEHANAHGAPHIDDEGHENDHGTEPHEAVHTDAPHGTDSHSHAPVKKKAAAKPAHGKPAHGKADKGHGGHGKPAAKPSGHGAPAKKKAAKSGHGGH